MLPVMRLPHVLIAVTLLALTGAGQAQEPVPVPVAPVQYSCNVETNFFAPTWHGKRPLFFNRTLKGDRPREWDSKTGPENVYGYAIVDASGAILNLYTVWMQSGSIGWPYVSRADLDEISMTLTFGSASEWISPDPSQVRLTRFDPAAVKVQIEAQQRKKIKRLLVLQVTQPGFGLDPARLGGLADVPGWRKSARITVRWPELQALGEKDKLVSFSLSTPVLGQYGVDYIHVRSGHLDLTPIPVVMDQFRLAEAKLQELARDPVKNCRKLEPPVVEDNPLAEI